MGQHFFRNISEVGQSLAWSKQILQLCCSFRDFKIFLKEIARKKSTTTKEKISFCDISLKMGSLFKEKKSLKPSPHFSYKLSLKIDEGSKAQASHQNQIQAGAYSGGRPPGGPVSHQFWRPGAKFKNVGLTPHPTLSIWRP